jgi:hypothetical protein
MQCRSALRVRLALREAEVMRASHHTQQSQVHRLLESAVAKTDPAKTPSDADDDVDDGEKSNWFKESYNVTWYIQIAVVILLFVFWVVAGMPK